MRTEIAGYDPKYILLQAITRMPLKRNQDLWVTVKDTFGFGSTTSCELCRHFGRDPYERLTKKKKPCTTPN
jgi:hypothetical protein